MIKLNCFVLMVFLGYTPSSNAFFQAQDWWDSCAAICQKISDVCAISPPRSTFSIKKMFYSMLGSILFVQSTKTGAQAGVIESFKIIESCPQHLVPYKNLEDVLRKQKKCEKDACNLNQYAKINYCAWGMHTIYGPCSVTACHKRYPFMIKMRLDNLIDACNKDICDVLGIKKNAQFCYDPFESSRAQFCLEENFCKKKSYKQCKLDTKGLSGCPTDLCIGRYVLPKDGVRGRKIKKRCIEGYCPNRFSGFKSAQIKINMLLDPAHG